VGVILAASMSLVVYAAALLAFRAVDFNELRGLLRRA
jgi:hypothetical protein